MHALAQQTSEGRQLRNLLRLMTRHNVFKRGSFVLRNGRPSPIYIDLRESYGNAELFEALCSGLRSLIQRVEQFAPFTGIVGVPYAALPYASVVSMWTKQPLLILRKQAKAYGTAKLLEGRYAPGQRVAVFDDVVSTGESMLETIEKLRAEGLRIDDVFCLLERGAEGRKRLEAAGVTLHSLANMDQVMTFLAAVGELNQETLTAVELPTLTRIEQISKLEIGWDFEDESDDASSETSA